MDYADAKVLVDKLIRMIELEGIDHHSVTEERKGGQRYIEFKISIKIK